MFQKINATNENTIETIEKRILSLDNMDELKR